MAGCKSSSRSAILNGESGFSLLEVLVAILLTAIIVAATFSTLLLTQADFGSSDAQMTLGLTERQILETLKNYQSASIAGPGNLDLNSGPCQSGLPACQNTWSLPGDSGVACAGANCPASCAAGNVCSAGAYALAIGCGHNVTALLPPVFQAAPFNGVMCYTVTDESGLSAGTAIADQSQFMPQVQLTVQWTKPSA